MSLVLSASTRADLSRKLQAINDKLSTNSYHPRIDILSISNNTNPPRGLNDLVTDILMCLDACELFEMELIEICNKSLEIVGDNNHESLADMIYGPKIKNKLKNKH